LEPLKIRLSGYGGQGIVLAGVIIGQAAVLDGQNAVQTQSYGSESRGGACKADVIISDDDIYEIEAGSFDCLVAMSSKAYNKYIPRLKSGGKLIVEQSVNTSDELDCDTYAINATHMAEKNFGRKIMGNMVMIGFMSAILGSPSRKSIKKSVRENVPKGTQQSNVKAFEFGYEEGLRYSGKGENGR